MIFLKVKVFYLKHKLNISILKTNIKLKYFFFGGDQNELKLFKQYIKQKTK